ncbi:MBL fold metallo-hydrolase [Pleionea sp. CnH1-48]|uniref:MBL fold metallo-hydrolase n=1 Tax=Pleionea sp. CnH1-48 TaxID=2954494 RepID=UPI002097CD52|nr:MBL fold metallo-hydrolase [Pleionea sp. CnH1-48]MCO7226832.1 MBL fold metallo-hydrolase [Pleionea sp. CnH1-48]
MKTLIKSLSLCLALAVTNTYSEEKKQELSFESTQVAPGIYMLSGVGGFTGGNIGLSIGKDGVVMIDDSMPPMLDIMKTAIKSVTKKPVDFVINTHVHGDHIANNAAMKKEGARIVAHENLRRHLVKKGMFNGKENVPVSEDALPVITFSHAMNFHLNGENARLIHVAHAHTDGDAVIFFKKSNVVHTGDVFFNGMFPFIDLNSGGSVDGYIKAQKKILKLSNDKTKIIPGHGPLASKEDLARSVAMLKDAKKLIAKAIKAGKSEDEVVAMNPLKKYHDKWNWGFITTERMTRQVYKGLTQTKKASHSHSHQH